MNAAALTAALKKEALRLGFDLVGEAPAVAPPDLDGFRRWLDDGYAGRMSYLSERFDAYCHPNRLLEGVKSLLMLGMNYRTEEPVVPGVGQGRVSRFAWGADYHEIIKGRLKELAEFHRRLTPEAKTRGTVDSAPLLERQFARLAGLGWIGKNNLLINPQFGSWFFLASLLTTEELEYDEPMAGDPCGKCHACLNACPTGCARRAAPVRC